MGRGNPGQGVTCVTFAINNTLTAMPVARGFYDTGRNIVGMDLTGFKQSRLQVRKLGTPGPAGSVVTLAYSVINPALAFNSPDWIDIASINIAVSAGQLDSGWQNLPAGAIGYVFLAPLTNNGDATTNPVMGNVQAFFR